MQSYIVRVYRKEQENPEGLVGLVEDVEKQETKPFKTYHELWEILKETGKRKTAGAGKGWKNGRS